MKNFVRFLGITIVLAGWVMASVAADNTLQLVQRLKGSLIGHNGNIILADVNGDGHKDIVARYTKNKKPVVGIWLWEGNKFSDTADCTIDLNFVGDCQITAGDLNGDGMADLAFLSQYSNTHPPKIVFGRKTWPALITNADILCGPVPNDSLFVSQGQYGAMTIGDFNGDGYGDLVYELQGNDTSGAFANLYGGRIIMYFGGAAMDSIPDWVYKGAQTYTITGTTNTITPRYFSPWHIATGDFNGDGKTDLLVGGWNAYSSISTYNNYGVMQSMYNCGSGLIFLGGSGFAKDSVPDVILMPSDKWLQYTTPATYLWLGYAIYNAGDINGDGVDDISLPGWYIDIDLIFKGNKAWTYAGTPNNVLVVRNENFAYTKNRFNFEGYADQNGVNLLSIGDVNGDGLGDLAVTRNFFGLTQENQGIDFFFSKPNESGVVKPDYSTNDYIQVMPAHMDYYGDGLNEFFAYDVNDSLCILKVMPVSTIDVTDVPDDQGGWVKLSWNSTVDNDVTKYPNFSIWRSAPSDTLGGQTKISSVSERGSKSGGTAMIQTSLGPRLWEWVKDVPAVLQSKYETTVPTLNDSSTATKGLTYFMVIAHTSDPNKFFISNIDSGYSIDNLAPLPPANLIAQIIKGKATLSWAANTEKDLAQYAVYKSDNSSIGVGTPVYAFTKNTVFVDTAVAGSIAKYYAVRAVDIHGNFSGTSNLVTVTTTGVRVIDAEQPLTYSLSQNFPNPFNPTTTIQYSIRDAGLVTLRVMNILGEVVAELENSYKPAGTYSVAFDASRLSSGVYYYQIRSGAFTQVNKMLLLK